jgi:hypothetical protein
MDEEFEYFGTPLANRKAAEQWARRYQHSYPYHTRVPTRKEVAEMSAHELSPLVIGWMVHSPIQIIPSRSQVFEVVHVMRQRPDAGQLTRLLELCEQFVSNHR